MSFRSRIRSVFTRPVEVTRMPGAEARREARRPPKPLTASQLYSGPAAQWGQYDPNSATMTGGSPAGWTGLSSPRGAAATQRADLPSGPGSRTGAGVLGRPVDGATGYHARQQQSPLAMARVQGDQSGRAAAEQALSQLQQVSREGWTPLDRLALDAAQRQSAMGERSQRDALLASSRARGVGGSALGFASALGAQQGAANRSADYATQIGLAGRERALGATQAAAGLGMGLDDRAFAQAAQRAAAVDAANMWFTGRQDDAAARAYEAQLAAAQAAQERARQTAGMVMGGVRSLFNAGTGLASLFGDEEEG